MSHPRLHLLNLPVDVLSLILRPLLTAPGGGVISLCPCTASPISPLPVLLTHPSLYAIACPLFYGVANSFLLDLTGPHGGHVRRCLKEAAEDEDEDEMERGGRQQQRRQQKRQRQRPLRQTGGGLLLLSLEARRRVQRLEMRIDRLRAWAYDELGRLVEDMAVQGELADLCLAVCYSSSSSSKSKPSALRMAETGDGIFERPPMAGLLALLADPDLRTARLRVTQTHGRAWCPFHADGVGHDEGGGGEGLVEIDWRAILREVDPEGRKRAVAWAVEG